MSTTELTEATETELLRSIEISVHSVFSVVRRPKLTHDPEMADLTMRDAYAILSERSERETRCWAAEDC
jgi:hypothetical protein